MPSSDIPLDPHDPRYELELQDALVLLALGEPVDPWVDVHRQACRRCQEDLAGLMQTVRVARATVPARAELDATPSPAVWDGIAAELGLGRPRSNVTHLVPPEGRPQTEPTTAPQPGPSTAAGRPARWRRPLLVAAAVVVVAGAAGGGYLVGRERPASESRVQVTARLGQMPGGPVDVAGTATVHGGSSGERLSVTTRGLPLRDGYYEVWLYDPQVNRMVAIGTLADDGSGTFPVPPGLDVRSYNVVDVSAQNYDGDPTHQQSVLRGGLTR